MARTTKRLIQQLLALLLLAGIGSSAFAQTRVVTYDLEDVRFTPTQQMTGSFNWTYEEGDFENGTGEFTQVHIPWYWSDLSELAITIDLTSIEFTFDGNLHDRGLDVTLHLLEPLSPTEPSAIDLVRSRYQVEVGIIHEGDIDSGSIVPQAPACPVDFNDDGELNFFDVSIFLSAFTAQDPIADLNADGSWNFFDVSAFLNAFTAGCP